MYVLAVNYAGEVFSWSDAKMLKTNVVDKFASHATSSTPNLPSVFRHFFTTGVS